MLSDQELILLDNLIYFQDVFWEGDSVAQIIDKIIYQLEKKPNLKYAQMQAQEWMELVSVLQSNQKLLHYKATNKTMPFGSQNTGTIVCFVDEISHPLDVNVIFKGTQNGYEWDDNGEGAYLMESDCQRAAADYINRLPKEYGNHLTVSGHSKGGNKAQYVTITTNRVARCVAEDGQGFSNEFCRQYHFVIEDRKNRIKNYCAENDYVNVIANTIAGTSIYIKTEFQINPFLYHKPNLILTQKGDFREEGRQAEWTKGLHSYFQEILDLMPEPQRSYVIDGVMGLLEGKDSEESAYNRMYSVLTAGGYWLAWMTEQTQWFGLLSRFLAQLLRDSTRLFSPSSYYDLTYFSVDLREFSFLQECMERHRNMLESMAERIRAMKMELKGTLYSQVRASFDVLAFQLQQRAVSCGEISDAVARICRNYKENETHVENLFDV
ncbi:Mbeg1-like protein [Candidatus Ventrimonas sp. KK005]